MEKLMDCTEVAQYLGRTERSVRHDVSRQNWHRTPKPLRIGRLVRWRPSDIQAWLEALAADQGLDQPTIRRRK